MTNLGPRPALVVEAAIRLLSSPGELPEGALESSLEALGVAKRLGQGGCEALRKNFRNGRLLERVFDAFTDSGNTASQDDAANMCAVLIQRAEAHLTHDIIQLCGSPQRFIGRLATLLTETDNDNIADHHPAIFDKAVALSGKTGVSAASLAFLLSAFSTDNEFGPAFPGPAAVPPLVWVGVFRTVVGVLTCEDQATRDKFAACFEHAVALVRHHMHRVTFTGSDDERAAYLAAIREDICPLVDTLAATLTSSDADKAVRGGAKVCLEFIFGFCCDFKNVTQIDAECFNDADGPVQRLMRVPNALQAYVAGVKSPTNTLASRIRITTLPLALPQMLADCGHRDAVYSSGCISMASDIAKRLDKESDEKVAFCAGTLWKIVGSDTDLTDARARIAVREGLPGALCEMTIACIKGQIDQHKVDGFINFAIRALRALVSYGDRMSSRGGRFRPDSVTQAILQHEAVKAMRVAGRQPGRRKGHQRQQQQQQQATVPKELLELFDEIESAASERTEKIIAELDIEGTQEGAEDTNGSKGVKKKTKGKRGGKGACTKESPSPSSCGAIGTSEDRSEQPEEDAEDPYGLPGPPSPSPPSPPRPSCSFSSASAAAAAGSGQQVGAGDGGDVEGGGFITVGRKKRGGKGTGGHTQQQQTNTADKRDDNSRVFPSSSSSSSESTRPSSSHSSVSGGPHNAPPLPFPLPPRPAAPPPRPPNQHTSTPAPFSSRAGCDEQGLAPLAAGGSSSSSLERAVESEGRSGQHRCGGEVSELELMRQQLEAMRLKNEAIERENKRLEEERESTECDICMASKKSIVLIPCRHFCLCGGCAAALMRRPVDQRLCPRCRQAITATRHVYL
ncbi:unnamed protein product [Vitrella brassicaformis CCMP3155]|uniref:RING-type domain-containing protein n=1 Tax=Vitrella brassicaformis (strain CCMP3155) TaxID=1169540 RepID=A0A0G4FP06_VITBC|nr:unnamed protein product [Vitrella brassicaformis CCMP3155]|eukprot:CEM15547.1 unnamed protein product [Vitrella brassicaformis CCMP3155]